MPDHPLRGAAAIVGVADAVDASGMLDGSVPQLEARMIREALDDAGLTIADVDGVACHRVGDSVQAKQPIGKSGETGLAAGDHLHFGVYLDGVPVLPVEWWDAKWINDNIAPKLEGQTGDEIAASQAPKKSARGVRKRRR